MEESRKAAVTRIKDNQKRLLLSTEGPTNPDSTDFCGAFASLDLDNSWDFDVFKKGFSIEIKKLNDEIVELDMIGTDPPIANALRRILIAEVPTVAISRVTLYQNTGVVHDENIAHRLGLIPIKLEPEELKWRSADGEFDETNSVVFTLHKQCSGDKCSIYSRDLQWKPMSDEQRTRFESNPPRPVDDDILITQLRSGQELECECFCERGVGKEHAKWSPVCTAFYRLMPDIRLTQPIVGREAMKLKKVCPMGVFDVEPDIEDMCKAVVKYPRKCTTCRECLESFPGKERGLELGKLKNHFLFSIESTGAIPAPALFLRALAKLKDKCAMAHGVLAGKGA